MGVYGERYLLKTLVRRGRRRDGADLKGTGEMRTPEPPRTRAAPQRCSGTANRTRSPDLARMA